MSFASRRSTVSKPLLWGLCCWGLLSQSACMRPNHSPTQALDCGVGRAQVSAGGELFCIGPIEDASDCPSLLPFVYEGWGLQLCAGSENLDEALLSVAARRWWDQYEGDATPPAQRPRPLEMAPPLSEGDQTPALLDQDPARLDQGFDRSPEELDQEPEGDGPLSPLDRARPLPTG